MLREFYDYLAKRLLDFFADASIKHGEKLILNLATADEVGHLYNAIDQLLCKEGKRIIYQQMDDELFETISFKTKDDIQLVIIPEWDMTNAYMTRLRNTVFEQCEKAAILIIGNNPIDSISGGTESLQKEGMPFHKDELIKGIKEAITNSQIHPSEKQVLFFDLKNKENADYLEMYSLTDYAEILSVLSKGHIDASDYKLFGLFADDELTTLLNDEKTAIDRIKDNHDKYKEFNHSVKYGNINDDFERKYSDDLIKKINDNIKLNSNEWDSGITYSEVMASSKKAEKKAKPLEIVSIDVCADGCPLKENIHFYVKNENKKGTKRNVLVFVPMGYSFVQLTVNISDYGANKLEFEDSKDKATASVSGKRVIVDTSVADVSINKIKIRCTSTERNDSFDVGYCIVKCDRKWFDEITSCFSIKTKADKKAQKSLVIECDSDELILNRHGENRNDITIENDLNVDFNDNDQIRFCVDDTSFGDDNIARCVVNVDGIGVPVLFKATAPINSAISGVKIEQLKLKERQSFKYKGNNKITFGTVEYNAREELRINLALEEQIVRKGLLSGEIIGDEIKSAEVKLSDNVSVAYNDFLHYFVVNDTLPSIAYYDGELAELANRYLKAVLDDMLTAEENKSLSFVHRELLRLGTVLIPEKEQIAFTAVHPINVAYQLRLASENKDDEIREDILKKLTVDNLVPYIHNDAGCLYKVHEQAHTPHWTFYCPAERKKFKGSREFVPKLVVEKIKSFHEHFSYLFNGVGGNKLIINAINMGDCSNLLRGIIDYYKISLRKGTDALSIIVNVYDDLKIYNTFEMFTHKAALKKYLNDNGIKEDNKQFSESELLNLIMSKVSYFRKNKDTASYEYCHLAFIEMDNETKEGYSNKHDIRSGTMLNGLLSGVTSMYYGDSFSYRTGYGCQYNLEYDSENCLIRLTDVYNSFMKAYGNDDPYSSLNAICTQIDEHETDMINKTYDCADWVVFIDPKVDLNFFKNDSKDVMIIHYSDQHTTSSGYDAITVTRKTEQYENILREYLAKNSLPTGDNGHIRSMIDMFNAVNGDWMLKLISSKSNFSKEKISIQSAIKLALAFYKNNNIIWVPISLEEILRVSGAVGLSKDDGLFSASNLGYDRGATSDDLLMFGVEVVDGKVKVHLYPLEVKIGYKDNNEVEKAVKQIKKTREIFDNKLINPTNANSLQTKVYRNFIAQIAIICAEKLELYKVWANQDWERIVNSDVRGKLLNDDFEISQDLHGVIGDGIVVSFKEGSIVRSIEMNDNVSVLRFFYSDGINYIVKSVDDIYNELCNIAPIRINMFEKKYLETNVEHHYITDNTVDEQLNNSGLLSDIDFAINAASESLVTQEVIANDIADDICCDVQDEKKYSGSEDVISGCAESSDPQPVAIEPETLCNPEPEAAAPEFIKSPDGMKILFGDDQNTGKPLYWMPNDTEKIMHPNTGIIGTMGTGKTQFTKSLILQLVREQHNNPGDKPLGILIFDYKGDYNQNKTDFINATGAKVYDLYHLPFNPFSISVSANPKPMLPVHIASTFKDTLSKCFGLGVKQEAALRDCIVTAYEHKGILAYDQNTWSNTPPTIYEVFDLYRKSDAFKEDSLYSALSELQMFQIFEPDATKAVPLYELIDGVTVINLSGYDESIQNLVVAITLDLFYSQMQANGHSMIDGKLRQLTKFILVDEADNFLKVGFTSLRKILKEGREFGVGTILSTQFLKHFDTNDDDFSKYIYSWIVHNVADLSGKDVRNLFNTTTKSDEEELFSEIKKLTKHHSFVKFGDSSKPYFIKDRAFWELLKDE